MTAPSIPRLSQAHLPTPIEPLPRLLALLCGPRLFIKRDDQTGLALGGIKTRKLEFLVAQAQAQPDVLRSAREACSPARVAVLGENTAEQRRLKAQACDHYEMLKGQPSIADQE
jgi:hypothetical protein